MAKKSAQPSSTDTAELCQQALRHLEQANERLLGGGAIFGGSVANLNAAQKQALAELLRQRLIVDLGTVSRIPYAVLADGRSPEDIKLELARAAIVERRDQKLALQPGTGTAFANRTDVPTRVRKVLMKALRELEQEGEVFVMKASGKNYFIFREALEHALSRKPQSNIEGQSHLQRQRTPGNGAGVHSIDGVAPRIVGAYRALRTQTGLRNVLIRSLLERSGVELSVLLAWLEVECRAQRANPTRGEATAVNQADLDAALLLDGDRFLYVELYE